MPELGSRIWPTQDQPLPVTLTDRSVTIATGGAAQQAAAALTTRKFLVVTNPSLTETCWFSTTGAATTGAGSIQLGPGAGIVFDQVVPTGAVSVIGPTTGQPITVKEA